MERVLAIASLPIDIVQSVINLIPIPLIRQYSRGLAYIVVGIILFLIVSGLMGGREGFIAGEDQKTMDDGMYTRWGGYSNWEGPKKADGSPCGTQRRYRSRACINQPKCLVNGQINDLEVQQQYMGKCDLTIGR